VGAGLLKGLLNRYPTGFKINVTPAQRQHFIPPHSGSQRQRSKLSPEVRMLALGLEPCLEGLPGLSSRAGLQPEPAESEKKLRAEDFADEIPF
jgi:hypothetical protein